VQKASMPKIIKPDYSILPSVDQLLRSVTEIAAPHVLKTTLARNILNQFRGKIQSGKMIRSEELKTQYKNLLKVAITPLKKVINGTGVILHTGLGRAAYSSTMTQQMVELLTDSYVNLELDLDSGQRGNRNDHIRPWLQAITSAENGILVNNNAAAVLLSLNTLANRKEVIISRGQLVEIGGSFRIPEILKKAGAKLVEVGTTNRTHPRDYESAITPRTQLLLWVHTSNYRIAGFTRAVGLKELVEIGRRHGVPVMADLGSGALIDIQLYGLSNEPLVSEVVKAGVDIVTFSIDKLLGGPQGGMIVGTDTLIRKVEKNHLLRALRCDKTQLLLTLEALKNYVDPQRQIPFYRDLVISITVLKKRAQAIKKQVSLANLGIDIVNSRGEIGSGASPTDTIPSVALQLKHKSLNAKSMAKRLRQSDVPVLGYIVDDYVRLDLRTVRVSEEKLLIRALNQLG